MVAGCEQVLERKPLAQDVHHHTYQDQKEISLVGALDGSTEVRERQILALGQHRDHGEHHDEQGDQSPFQLIFLLFHVRSSQEPQPEAGGGAEIMIVCCKSDFILTFPQVPFNKAVEGNYETSINNLGIHCAGFRKEGHKKALRFLRI